MIGTSRVKLIRLPEYDAQVRDVRVRLTRFLTKLRLRRHLKYDVPADGLGDADHLRIQARAEAVVARRCSTARRHSHVSPEMQDRLLGLQGRVPAITVESEHTADEIAAALHAEMPWMAPATEAAWMALRHGARSGTPVRIGPLLLVGSAGIGKSAWARRIARRLGMPAGVIDASQGLGSFSLAGTERGWGSAQPGRPVETMLEFRRANPVILVDELCKAGRLRSMGGISVAFQPALLGLLEPESARSWQCPYFRVTFDMSHVSWIMTANTLEPIAEPVRNRCTVLRIPDLAPGELQAFARRQGEAMGLPAPAIEAVSLALARAQKARAAPLDLRDAIRMLERADMLANRPTVH